MKPFTDCCWQWNNYEIKFSLKVVIKCQRGLLLQSSSTVMTGQENEELQTNQWYSLNENQEKSLKCTHENRAMVCIWRAADLYSSSFTLRLWHELTCWPASKPTWGRIALSWALKLLKEICWWSAGSLNLLWETTERFKMTISGPQISEGLLLLEKADVWRTFTSK